MMSTRGNRPVSCADPCVLQTDYNANTSLASFNATSLPMPRPGVTRVPKRAATSPSTTSSVPHLRSLYSFLRVLVVAVS